MLTEESRNATLAFSRAYALRRDTQAYYGLLHLFFTFPLKLLGMERREGA